MSALPENTTQKGRLYGEKKKNAQKNRFALTYLNLASGRAYFCYLLTGWQLRPYAEIVVPTHQFCFFFYESHVVSFNVKQRNHLSVLKNRNAKQSFPERALKSFHNQKHTYLISPLLLGWRLCACWLEFSHNLIF